MPVKIRLMRIGATKRPFYRVVAVDERKKRTGAYLELLGTYNPITNPKEINLKQDRIDEWLKKGAVPSDGFLRIIGQAPQRPARKPKKAKQEAPAAAPAAAAETPAPAEGDEAPVEETVAEAAPEASEETPTETTTETEEAPAAEETPEAEEAPAEDQQPSE